jgi:hypothetical protein
MYLEILRIRRLLPVIGLFLGPVSLAAQVPPDAPQGRLRVFFDCQGPQCDNTYYRTEIDWVDWVRDAQDSNVHVIMTSQMTGAGGREYQLDFIGRGAAVAYQAQSRYQSRASDTQREELDAIAYTLALGLAQFANANGFRNVVRIEGIDPGVAAAAAGVQAPDQVADPWNLWTFRINTNGNISGESTRKSYQFNGGFNASRVTPIWKTSIGGNGSLARQEIRRTNGTLFVDERTNWSVNARLVYSLAQHWSVGIGGGPARQTQQNQKLRVQLNPGIEYSYFPYEEATRRSLTVFYEIGPVYRGYFQETIYGETSEILTQQALSIDFSQRQPWGSASVTASASSYMHDFARNNASLRGSINYRITRGLDLNLNANVSSVNDQIYLSGAGLTEEERLLRIRQEATDYTYGGSFGLSYQFGSIFNNVVNNRF